MENEREQKREVENQATATFLHLREEAERDKLRIQQEAEDVVARERAAMAAELATLQE